MAFKEKKFLNDLEKFIDQNQKNKIDLMILYSLVEKNQESVDHILELDDNEIFEIKAKDLKDFFIDYKILSSILKQSISNTISIEEQTDINNSHYLDLEIIEEDNEELNISILISYNNYLEKNDYLVDDKMKIFLEYIEQTNADKAFLAYCDLKEDQKNSVPLNIQKWINKHSIYS